MNAHPLLKTALVAALFLAAPSKAEAFCGFFVGSADTKLFNDASKVVLVHDEGNTVLTMVNDYKGEPRSFALVVPVPVVLDKELVRVVDAKYIARVDAYSSPRLVEYFDPDPCAVVEKRKGDWDRNAPAQAAKAEDSSRERSALSLGVTIEAAYTVGEYDIEILSAKQSDGLETYLRQNKYNIPKNAATALAPYIRTGLKFFVAKVNLKEKAKSGSETLRPLQFAFPDKRFMLPIRLGMLNADGPQDLIAFVITKQFRAETTNYRNPKLPADVDVPTFVKDDFTKFYRDMFRRSVSKENGKAVFLEYAWNMAWCDPCADNPLSTLELQNLGVWWLDSGANQTFITRLHARYTPDTFPEDLMLKVTRDNSNFQARYVLRHPFDSKQWCDAIPGVKKQLETRREQEMNTLANLTGWDPAEIRGKMKPLPAVYLQNSNDADPGWTNRIKELFKGGN